MQALMLNAVNITMNEYYCCCSSCAHARMHACMHRGQLIFYKT